MTSTKVYYCLNESATRPSAGRHQTPAGAEPENKRNRDLNLIVSLFRAAYGLD
jgi:hypothetical protein